MNNITADVEFWMICGKFSARTSVAKEPDTEQEVIAILRDIIEALESPSVEDTEIF